ncbi:phosphatase PAP2 family protein [Bacillus testis]|uniref:phosphatase PAP2 family protein n=1 Tax=Bacillus testis TaxID=1622072 RepID=UPI00067F1B9A|nr:phosphatase PAP2 family protein [Bacillus testis]
MKKKFLWVSTIVSLVVFVIFSILTSKNGDLAFDKAIMSWIDRISSPGLENAMDMITIVGKSEVILFLTLLIAALLFFMKKDWLNSLFIIFITGSGVVLNYVLKILFHRERPDDEINYIEAFGHSFKMISYSFPSGHTMRISLIVAFLIYLCIIYLRHKWSKALWITLLSFILIVVGFSRVVLGEHFPSDVVAAISASFAWFSICLLVLSSIHWKRFRKRQG